MGELFICLLYTSRSGAILDDEFSKLNEAANELMASKLFVDDS